MDPRATITAFDTHLVARGLDLKAIVVGGSALALIGVTSRQTRDFDIIAPELSRRIVEAAREFAQLQRRNGIDLIDDWLNNGPSDLARLLPEGWELRVQLAFEGTALTLHALGRPDLPKTKLFALCDRGTDLPDCIALAPTAQELTAAHPWVALQDANPDWPKHVDSTFADLSRRLGHGV